ncbi:hypothetical protein AAC387_Pa05g0001 [Persea americana]
MPSSPKFYYPRQPWISPSQLFIVSIGCLALGIAGIVFGSIAFFRPVSGYSCLDVEPLSVSVSWENGDARRSGDSLTPVGGWKRHKKWSRSSDNPRSHLLPTAVFTDKSDDSATNQTLPERPFALTGKGQEYWQDERITEEMPSCFIPLILWHIATYPLVVETIVSQSSKAKGLFYALIVNSILKCSIDAGAFEGVGSKLQSVLKDARSLLDFYYSIGGLVLIKGYVPNVFDNFSENMVVDGSTNNLGVFLLAIFLISKASYENVAKMIRRIAADLRPLSDWGADVFLLAFFFISKASYENVEKMSIFPSLVTHFSLFKRIRELKHHVHGVPIAVIGTKLGWTFSCRVQCINSLSLSIVIVVMN